MVLRLPDSWSNWNLEMLVFEERGKLEYPEKNLSEQRREPTTNSTHIWCRRQDLIPGHIYLVGGERSHHCAIPCLNSCVISILYWIVALLFVLIPFLDCKRKSTPNVERAWHYYTWSLKIPGGGTREAVFIKLHISFATLNIALPKAI